MRPNSLQLMSLQVSYMHILFIISIDCDQVCGPVDSVAVLFLMLVLEEGCSMLEGILATAQHPSEHVFTETKMRLKMTVVFSKSLPDPLSHLTNL